MPVYGTHYTVPLHSLPPQTLDDWVGLASVGQRWSAP